MFIRGLFLPETPNSLVEQGRLEEGRRILERVRGTSKVDVEFEDLIDASNVAKAIKHPFRNLLKRKNRPQLVIGALRIPAFQQLTGNNSILFYAPVIFQSLGFGSGASLWSSAITSAALVVATLISMAYVDKFGRRAFFLEAGCEMIICTVAVAITLALRYGQGKMLPKGIGIFLLIVICIFVLAYGRSWGPLRCMIFTALIAQCFLAALCHLKNGIFLLFAALIVIMSAFIFFLLPETKHVPIKEIYLLWQNHWYWKRYREPEGNEDELKEQSGQRV
ncbi:hypothetical protein BUALT_Bualt16G0064400 [Buddleja alternifolia]|uniref:Uncharacterized protein n=1 Tax=Buddleja alternifolia TaxID=168488 RepID=A0AAV6W9Q0_9LAMI|nr:hypothetical protein BUALT_Bualt16G0064400 [Buddleja alternifolia]